MDVNTRKKITLKKTLMRSKSRGNIFKLFKKNDKENNYKDILHSEGLMSDVDDNDEGCLNSKSTCNIETNDNINNTEDLGKPKDLIILSEDVTELPEKFKIQADLEDREIKTSDLGDSLPPSTPSSTQSSESDREDDNNNNDDDTKTVSIFGITGMHNLGNSCYMNSILQCIAHIDILSEYFALDIFTSDVSDCNTLSKRKRTLSEKQKHAELIGIFSNVLKSLWDVECYEEKLIQDFHDLIGQLNSDYKGGEQQDAQEFLMWLIDKLHEETTLKLSKPKLKDFKKRKHHSEDEQAVVAFASHTNYLQSYVQSLFLSQYRSTITCSKCRKQSSTFDPFTCVSLPIPQKPTKPVYVNVIFHNSNTTPIKIGLNVNKTSSLNSLVELIKSKTDIEELVLIELASNGTPRFHKTNSQVSCLPSDGISLYALELEKGGESSPVKETELSIDQFVTDDIETDEMENVDENYLMLVVSNVEVWGNEQRRFGLPMVHKISTSASFKDLQSAIRKNMSANVRDLLHKTIKERGVKLGLRLAHPTLQMKEFLHNEFEHPLKNDIVTSCFIQHTTSDGNSRHDLLYLVAEWEPVQPGWCMGRVGISLVQEDKSCTEIRELHSKVETTDLDSCLNLQTQDETLEDEWKCPYCNLEQKNVVKKLTLWSLPDILVFHLKRFDQLQRGKISTLVDFPVEGLNMSPHVATTKASKWKNKKYQKESVRLNYLPPPQTEEECLYDLKAVCNHLGYQIHSGHYTASCLNSMNDSWYTFDDRHVSPVNKESVVTTGAYLLFYQRRKLTSRIPDNIYLTVSKGHQFKDQHWSRKIQPHSIIGDVITI